MHVRRKNSQQNFSCSINCEGMYADFQKTQDEWLVPVQHDKLEDEVNRRKISKLVNEYNACKKNKLQNFIFNPTKPSTNFGKSALTLYQLISFTKGDEQPSSTLKLVQIHLDDGIERDEKVKFTAALSLVGGTMGLLTGFSIMSGIEVVFFLFKLVSRFVVKYLKEKFQKLKE